MKSIPHRGPATVPPRTYMASGTVLPSPASVIGSDALFGERRELVIEHAGSYYRLRITQNNKLILTK